MPFTNTHNLIPYTPIATPTSAPNNPPTARHSLPQQNTAWIFLRHVHPRSAQVQRRSKAPCRWVVSLLNPGFPPAELKATSVPLLRESLCFVLQYHIFTYPPIGMRLIASQIQIMTILKWLTNQQPPKIFDLRVVGR